MRSLKVTPARICSLLIAWVLLGWLSPPTVVMADVGPVRVAQGAAITPGEEPTRVQMMTETVTLSVEMLAPPDDQSSARIDEQMVVHVVGVFEMRNRSAHTESLDVWFPLTTGVGYGDPSSADYPSQAENFQAWVDGEPVTVTEMPGRDLLGFRNEVPWATWQVTFPPGQDVQLRVAYDIHPIDWGGWAVVHYILETGAGWYGPIRQGTVTFRLPYEVTPLNVQLAEIRQAYTGPDRPFEVTVDGTDVTWRFTDLEPEPPSPDRIQALDPIPDTDNLILPMMPPSAWAEIQAAEAAVEADPNSVAAPLRLAQALEAGTQRVKWFWESEANARLLERTDAAYRRALELAPQDVDVRVAYLEWLAIPRYRAGDGLALGEGLDALLAETQELAPGDQRLRRIEVAVHQWREEYASTSDEVASPETTSPEAAEPTPTTLMPASGSPSLGALCPGALIVIVLLRILYLLQRSKE